MTDKNFENDLEEAFSELEAAERELDLQLLYEDIDDDFYFEPLSGDTAILKSYEGEAARVVVPGRIGGFRVTAIADGAFFMREALRELILPDTVEHIHSFAIQECGSLERLVLPAGLHTFGEMAVCGVPFLAEIELPAACERYTLRDGILFTGDGEGLLLCPACCGLREYEVPAGVRYIANGAFDDCRTLERITLPAGLHTIGPGAFAGTALREVDLPDSLTTLGEYAFSACRALRRVSLGEDLWHISGSCFVGCFGLEEMTLHPLNPALRLEDGFLTDGTGQSLLYGVPGRMKGKVCLPRSVREIGGYAFAGSPMTALQLHDDVEYIRDHAFAGCDRLQAIRIPEKVQHIGFFTFLGCEALIEVIFHEGVRTVSGFAFMGCTALKTVRLHRHTLLDTCEGDNFFYECPARIELLP